MSGRVKPRQVPGGSDGGAARRPSAAGRAARRGGRLRDRARVLRGCRGARSLPLSGCRPRRWCITSAPRSSCSWPSSGGCGSASSRPRSDRLGEQPDLATAARAAWTRTSDPRRWPEFRLFFAVYGRALQAPQQFAGFLERVVADWMSALVDAQGPDTDPATAARTATLVIATIRGLLLDLLATGDRDRSRTPPRASSPPSNQGQPPGRRARPSCRAHNGDAAGGCGLRARCAEPAQQVEGAATAR